VIGLSEEVFSCNVDVEEMDVREDDASGYSRAGIVRFDIFPENLSPLGLQRAQ